MPDGRARGLRSYESSARRGAAGRISPRVSGDVPRHARPRRLSHVISRLWSHGAQDRDRRRRHQSRLRPVGAR